MGCTYIEYTRDLLARVSARGRFFVIRAQARDLRLRSHKRKRVIQHEACYETGQNELDIDKWPSRAVQKKFQKSEKKACHPLKC